MKMRLGLAIAFTGLLCGVALRSVAADRWGELGDLTRKLDAIAPTPMGDGHLGEVASGKCVQLRFPVPADEAVGYWLNLSCVVGYSGKGTRYQLLLRRDKEDGPVIHEGPVVVQGDEWNAANLVPIEITASLTAADRERGYIDIFVTGQVEGDGWTVYRHNAGRPIRASAAVLTAEVRQQMATAAALCERGVSVIPVPQQITLTGSDSFRVAAGSRILCPGQAPDSLKWAAEELQAMVRERTGLELAIAVVAAGDVRNGDIVLGTVKDRALISDRIGADPAGPEAYRLRIVADRAEVLGGAGPGCFYGAMTLGQMLRTDGAGAAAPCGEVNDAPSFPYRIIQYDIARGQTVNVEYVKRLIRELARCKINALLFYMEDDFRFRKYPFLGREGTFTHEKANELAEFARRYHMQLIPQFESLGHAGAVLGHDELKGLREKGGAWVFCTCEPGTWEFLDSVVGELVEAFPTTEFIHTGGDEFEMGFGVCEKCKAKGIGPLYAEHMNRLNQLVKKYGKTMMFWPSHSGPTPALSNMTIQYQALLEKDCIPTEWIYHGPATYPTIEEYQKLGFKDLYCSPAVESYSRLWPDHTTTVRGISGFYRAGAERKCGGAYCTTWEFMHGALIENSMYGLLYSAECAWNPRSTPRTDYDRRFADHWWGLTGGDVVARMQDTVFDPVPPSGPAAAWRSTWLPTKILWTDPANVMREWMLKQPAVGQNAGTLQPAMDAALERAKALSAAAKRNQLSFRSMTLAFRMLACADRKLTTFRDATAQYSDAVAAAPKDAPAAAAKLQAIDASLRDLAGEMKALAAEYQYFVANCGAYKGDVERLEKQAGQLTELADKLAGFAGKMKNGEAVQLPAGSTLGFPGGELVKLGDWAPAQMSTDMTEIRFDATKLLAGPCAFDLEWEYTKGAHGLSIKATRLSCDGTVVFEDVHDGWAGGGSHNHVYRLELKAYDPKAKYEITGEVASAGGTESAGTVWLIRQTRP